jgi:hypothetical protein
MHLEAKGWVWDQAQRNGSVGEHSFGMDCAEVCIHIYIYMYEIQMHAIKGAT